MLLKLIIVAAFATMVPASAASDPVIRNVYAEAAYRGASTFLTYVDEAKLTKTLKDPTESLTVLAPTNMAFQNLPPSIRNQLDTDAAFRMELVRFHILQGQQYLNTSNEVIETLAGILARVVIYTFPNLTAVSGSPVLLPNNLATNGLVQVMSRVLYPVPSGSALDVVSDDPNYSMFYLALTKASATSFLDADDITLFALPNEAFQRLPAGVFSMLLEDIPLLTKVIRTHLVSSVVYTAYVVAKDGALLTSQSGEQLNITVTGLNGAVINVNGALVTSRDINVKNGVLHVISDVILPAGFDEEADPSFSVVV